MVHGMTNFNPRGKAVKDDPAHLSLKDFNQVHVFREIFFRAMNRGRQVTFELIRNEQPVSLGQILLRSILSYS